MKKSKDPSTIYSQLAPWEAKEDFENLSYLKTCDSGDKRMENAKLIKGTTSNDMEWIRNFHQKSNSLSQQWYFLKGLLALSARKREKKTGSSLFFRIHSPVHRSFPSSLRGHQTAIAFILHTTKLPSSSSHHARCSPHIRCESAHLHSQHETTAATPPSTSKFSDGETNATIARRLLHNNNPSPSVHTRSGPTSCRFSNRSAKPTHSRREQPP